MKSAYDIEACDSHQAKKKAKARYAEDFGFEIDHISAYIIDEQWIESKRINQKA